MCSLLFSLVMLFAAIAKASSQSSVQTNKASYAVGEQIVVTFVDGNPQSDDWIGIFQASTSTKKLIEGALWLWTCGSQDCGSSVS